MSEILEEILLRVSKSPTIDLGEIDAASQLIIEACCQGLAVERVGIWLLINDGIKCTHLIDNDSWQATDELILYQHQFPNYFAALHSERVIKANDAQQHPSTREFTEVYLKPLGIKSMLDIPIRHKGKMVGIICCEHRHTVRLWQPQELVFTASLADLCGRVLNANERNQLQRQLEDINRNLEAIVKSRTEELEASLQQLKAAQKKLIEQEKLASLGGLVAGVAHEINTPLGVAITSFSCIKELLPTLHADIQQGQLTREKLENSISVSAEAVDIGLSNLSRAANLVSDFKLVAADQTNICIEKIHLAQYIRHITHMLKPLLKKSGVALTLALDETLSIETYPGLFTQALTNLINNAVAHAFEQTASPTITVSCYSHNDGVAVSCADNGAGIHQDDIKKVFEPFYTTARHKGGTGLGLAIVYNIVRKQLCGDIFVKAEVNRGTQFEIVLTTKLKEK